MKRAEGQERREIEGRKTSQTQYVHDLNSQSYLRQLPDAHLTKVVVIDLP